MAKQEAHPITIVHTESGMCLTTVAYSDSREAQMAFDDYKTSLGPYEIDELIEYLEIEYPTRPPFDAWDVRGVAGRAGAYAWAPSASLPTGPGFTLGSTRADSLRLAIDGFQFPDADDPRKRDSWYMVEGEATLDGEAWDFRWPALTCGTPPLLVGWLLRIAEWLTTGADGDPPEPPWLIEPNLQVPLVRAVNGRAEISVALDLEFLAPDRRNGRRGAGSPAVLRLRATAEELQQAAIDFAATVARYPVNRVATRPVRGQRGAHRS